MMAYDYRKPHQKDTMVLFFCLPICQVKRENCQKTKRMREKIPHAIKLEIREDHNQLRVILLCLINKN